MTKRVTKLLIYIILYYAISVNLMWLILEKAVYVDDVIGRFYGFESIFLIAIPVATLTAFFSKNDKLKIMSLAYLFILLFILLLKRPESTSWEWLLGTAWYHKARLITNMPRIIPFAFALVALSWILDRLNACKIIYKSLDRISFEDKKSNFIILFFGIVLILFIIVFFFWLDPIDWLRYSKAFCSFLFILFSISIGCIAGALWRLKKGGNL